MQESSSEKMRKRVLVNLGCGPDTRETRWIDCDGSWNVLASRLPLGLGSPVRKLIGHKGRAFPCHVKYVNLTNRLPFADQSADAVYYSHVLEHLYLEQGRGLLAESWRILKPGGIVRILVPDTEYYIKQYLSAQLVGDKRACLALNERLMFRPLAAKTGLLRRLYNYSTDFHSHKFMYDRAYLADCLSSAGFIQISEVGFNESRVPEISDVELAGRVGAGYGFGFEAMRPTGE